jgi:hypothetical protein
LLLLVVFGAVTLGLVASILKWSANNSRLIARNNQYYCTLAAAEAATEAVITRLETDYQTGGDSTVQANLASYRLAVPTSADNSYWTGYNFGNDLGQAAQTQVAASGPLAFVPLGSTYSGLSGYATTYQITSDARDQNSSFNLTAGVQQTLQTATIPLFQFAAFYNIDMEVNPGPNMTITGPVHGNANIYMQPQASLIFQGDVTAVGNLVSDKMPGDPTVRTPGTITFQGEHDGGVSTQSMPIGTNNSPAAVRQVVEMPPAGESALSPMGLQRFYNEADVIIRVTDLGVVATSGLVNNFASILLPSDVNQFVDTSVTFFNKRENLNVQAAQIDISKLIAYNSTNTLLRPILSAGDIRTVYIADQRTQTSSTEPGIVLVNGKTVLPQGLTIVSPDPIYIKGDYNVVDAARGTSDTSQSLPAAVIGDAVTILSNQWNNSNSSKALSSRPANDTTVNAALLTGIVPTTSGSYSGGLENLPRFLEDWSGHTFTYSGSMIVMFPSVYATGLWQGTGSTFDIYNPPTRNWAFDQNFKNPLKLPPATPSSRVIIRAQWASIKPNMSL